MKKNVASQVIGAQLFTAAGVAVTSGTTTVYVTGDGGTQASTGTATHEGQGFWSYLPSQAETNFDHVAFTFVNASAVPVTVQAYPTFPQTGDAFARLGAPAGASISADIATKATPAQVNTEVLDVLVTDTFAELAAVPAATSSLKDKLNWLFALARNKVTQTATTQTLRNDADSGSIATSTLSDDATTLIRAEWS